MSDEGGAPKAWSIGPRDVLMIFTAGWLGGLGALTVLDDHSNLPARLIGFAEAASATLWFAPKTRLFGFGAMLAVLTVAVIHHMMAGQIPGPLIFYAAVVLYLTAEEGGEADKTD